MKKLLILVLFIPFLMGCPKPKDEDPAPSTNDCTTNPTDCGCPQEPTSCKSSSGTGSLSGKVYVSPSGNDANDGTDQQMVHRS